MDGSDDAHLLLLYGYSGQSIYQRYNASLNQWRPHLPAPVRREDRAPYYRAHGNYVIVPARYFGDESFILHMDGTRANGSYYQMAGTVMTQVPYTIEKWSLTTRQWSRTSWHVPDGPIYDCGFVYANEHVYVVGGMRRGRPSDQVWSLDCHNEKAKWKVCDQLALPHARFMFASCVWDD
jgi:hypothetical protein